MMNVITNNGVAYITVGDSSYSLPETLEGLIDCEELLGSLTMEEVFNLCVLHGGISDDFKDFLTKKVTIYGDSLEVSSFICQGNNVWLDKEQRSSIMNLLNYSGKLDDDKFELILHGEIHEFSVKQVKDLIAKLEEYSYKCLINTTKHLQNINKINTMKEIIEYDFTTGYPEKITLE